MANFLERLQKKPIAYRRKFLVVSTISLTAIIILIWLSTLNFNYQTDNTDNTAINQELKPIDEIKTSVGNFIDTVKSMGAGIFGSGSTTESGSKQE